MVRALSPPPPDEELLELELLDEELDELLDEELLLLLLLEELELDGSAPPSPPQAASVDAARPVKTSCSLFMGKHLVVILRCRESKFAELHSPVTDPLFYPSQYYRLLRGIR